jgi:predicted RND superfamily exporter protein
MSNLVTDTSAESFLRPDDPAVLVYNAFREQYGSDELAVIALRAKEGDVFREDFLLTLKALHEDLENTVPHLDEVTSLINARNTRGENDTLIVEDLLENWPETPRNLDDIKRRALSNPLYTNALISEDGTLTTILVRPLALSDEAEGDVFAGFDDENVAAEQPGEGVSKYLTPEHNTAFVTGVKKVIERHRSADVAIYLAGSPVVRDTQSAIVQSDAPKFLMLCLGGIAVLLLAMFRRPAGLLLPMLVIVMSLFATLGLMAGLYVSFKLPTTILPAFLAAVGVGASVHVLSLFYQRLQLGEHKYQAIEYALGHSGLAVVLTSVTTAGGLLSFAWADMAPIAELGIFSAVGVLFSMLFSLLFVPAMVVIFPSQAKIVPDKRTVSASTLAKVDSILSGVGHFSARHAEIVTIVACGVIVMGIWGATRLHFSHNPLEWLPEKMEIRQHNELMDQELKGTVSLEMVIDTGRENGLYDPELLRKLELLAEELSTEYASPTTAGVFVGKTLNVTDILKEIHKALHENRDEFYTIPQNPALIPQEFLLFENSGSDDLEDYVDSQFSKARFTIKLPYLDAVSYAGFLRDVERRFGEVLGPDVKVAGTGTVAIYNRIIAAAMDSTIKSFSIAFVVITVLMIFLIGELRLGIASMIPNLLPIIFCLGLMGWGRIPLDMVTILIGSVILGIAVDDTIHFMHGFRRYLDKTGDIFQAIQGTLMTSGRAMLFTSVVLSLGFFVYVFATLNHFIRFGILTGITILVAFFADIFLAPAIVLLMMRHRQQPVHQNVSNEGLVRHVQ